VTRFLHLQVGPTRTLPILRARQNIPPVSRRENNAYKVPSKYMRRICKVLYIGNNIALANRISGINDQLRNK
jgi:hypothetical protein